jgi:hypothetical protein
VLADLRHEPGGPYLRACRPPGADLPPAACAPSESACARCTASR